MKLAIFAIALSLPAPIEAAPLNDLVRDYLRSNGADTKLEDAIIHHPEASPKNIIRAIRTAQLWNEQQPGLHDLPIQLGAAQTTYRVHISVPDNYSVDKRWPLVIALHGSGSCPEDIMHYMRSLLGDCTNDYIIAAPEGFGSMHLRGDADETNRPRDLVVALRHQFRLDDRRIFLMGYSLGGHNTWLGGILHADLFAGIMPLATPLQIVGNDVLFEELLPNLRNTSTLFVWGENDNLNAEGRVREDGGNTAWNRHMSKVMRDVGVRDFVSVELPGVGHGGVVPPAGALNEWLKQTRRRYPKEVHHVFRLPENSNAYWIRATELQGEPLPDGELKIHFKKDEDPRKKQRAYLTQRLGLVEASINGQTIRLRSRKTQTIELLLHDKLIDLDKPVTIMRGSRVLYKGKIPRDLRVLLREAATTWDFDRLVSARVIIPRGRRIYFNDDK
ncbi:MAG: hypothetical protein H6819_12990 [Phycisphaerales bacterium]|nr:hypothetical protein [Phycisphaerales bacterium]MCB9856749.1 hypothetical protein [Phycisphaerales bacterium]MCB9862124.1 hypothetical protein [Phycisphaerales bacterium]